MIRLAVRRTARCLAAGLLVTSWGCASGASTSLSVQPQVDAPCPVAAPTPNPLVAMMDAPAPAERTQVLIVGTPHLRVLPAQPEPSSIDPVLDVLARFQPDIVAVESMPAWLIADMERNAPSFDAALRYFAADRLRFGQAAQAATGRSRVEAEAYASALLTKWSNATAATAQRLELVLTLLAAYDLDSALLQWSYLSVDQRRTAPGVSLEIREFLDRELAKPNEKITIALALARRLGLPRIAAIDDNREAAHLGQVAQELGPAMQENPAFKAAAEAPIYAESQDELRKLAAAGESLLPFYQYINSVDYARTDLATQWGSSCGRGCRQVRIGPGWRCGMFGICGLLAISAKLARSPREVEWWS